MGAHVWAAAVRGQGDCRHSVLLCEFCTILTSNWLHSNLVVEDDIIYMLTCYPTMFGFCEKTVWL
jgi:hypothetical protein